MKQKSPGVKVGGLRWAYLCLGFCGMLTIGVIYGWSLLKIPLAEEFGWSVSDMALVYTTSMCFYCGGSVLAAVLCKHISFRWVLFAAGGLLCGGFQLMTGLKGRLGGLLFSYGILVGLGIGMAYNVLISVVCGWFPDRKGVASGALMMGFGMSTMLLGQLLTRLLPVPNLGWRRIYSAMGIGIMAVLLLCGIFLKRVQGNGMAGEEKRLPEGCTFTETVRQSSYWMFYIYGILSAATGSTVIGFAQDLALSVGATAAMAAVMVGLLSICNGIGRILCGIVMDVWGLQFGMRLFSLITVAVAAVMLAAIELSSLPLAVAAFCLAGISYAACPTTSTVFISSVYGGRDFALNYALGNTKLFFSSFVATIVGRLLAETGSYVPPFLLLAGMAGVAVALNERLRRYT